MDSNPTASEMHQKLQETPAEHARRESQDFQSVERAVSTRSSHARSASSSSWLGKLPLVDNLSSYLGERNPLATEARPADTEVWLLDTVAYRPQPPNSRPNVKPGGLLRRLRGAPREPPWQAEAVAAYFDRNTGQDVSAAVVKIGDEIGLGNVDLPDAECKHRIAERVRPFVQGIAPAKYVNVVLPPGQGSRETVKKLGPGSRNAVSDQTISGFGEGHQDGDVVQVPAQQADVAPLGPMNVHFADPEGWLVISDVDDTVKVTLTPSPIGILTSTFISEPTPTPTIPQLYATLNTALGRPAWFYLSASPYNLYPWLRAFLRAYYPAGPLLLRPASWMDPAGLLASLTQGTQAYKVGQIERIHRWLPRRRVLCVGDSTQSDPEAYGEAYRRYGGAWVRGIWIRKVTGVAGMDEKAKNSRERFEEAFKGVPERVWRVFETGQELEGALSDLVVA